MKIIRWFKTIRELNEAHDAQNAVLARMQAELDAVRYAAHMPDDYKFGIASWINQNLYACYIGASISPHISKMIEAGQLVFPNAPAWKELDALRDEQAALLAACKKFRWQHIPPGFGSDKFYDVDPQALAEFDSAISK